MSDETRKTTRGADIEKTLEAARKALAAQAHELRELAAGKPGDEKPDLRGLLDVPVELTVEVGQTRMTLGELMRLGPGTLVELGREAHEPADILVNGKVVAHGEVVTIDQSYGVRITSID